MGKTARASAQKEGETMNAADEWLNQIEQRDARWTNEQRPIFDWFENGIGNLIVRARAGTGKTTTMIEGVSRAPEHAILLAAFNKAIATELQERVSNPRAQAKTLHSLGFGFIKRNWRVRMDERRERAIVLAREAAPGAPFQVQRLVRDIHTKAREVRPLAAVASEHDGLRLVEGIAVRFDLMPDEASERKGWTIERVAAAALAAMRAAMRPTPTIDFADMIFLPLVHRWVSPLFDLVVVDEAQDMTPAQLALAIGSCSAAGRVCVLGDDRQNLYGFRGTDPDGIDSMKRELRAPELGLTVTHRCPRLVVEIAAKIVPDYRASASAIDGEVVSVAYDKMLADVRVGDFVLSRKNAPLVRVCMELLKRGTRATIRGNDISKGIVALLDTIRPPGAGIDIMLSCLQLWLTKETAKARKNLTEELAEERVAFVQDQAGIVIALADGCENTDQLQSRITNLFPPDDDARPSVVCASVHRAKGLEADNVFLLTWTFKSSPETAGVDDESNILYVAITRAKKRLAWVSEGVA